MGLDPVAFDIETSGFQDAEITVSGFAHDLGETMILNIDGRDAPEDSLAETLDQHSTGSVRVETVESERALLDAVAGFVDDSLDGDRHYLTAFNGETWDGGFDLPFCRTRFLQHGLDWPFGNLAYADMMALVDRFDTDSHRDLAGVYDVLVGDETCDPFDDSAGAVEAFENGEWLPLLKHNLADIQRTRALALLAERFVAKSDFNMKNLEPPHQG